MTADERVHRTARRIERAGVIFVIATILLIAGVVYAVWGVQSVTERVTILERSPCTLHPAGDECQQIRREADRAKSLVDACIPLRLTLTADAYRQLTRCPK